MIKKYSLFLFLLISLFCCNESSAAANSNPSSLGAAATSGAYSSPLDSLEALLRNHPQLQENVYLQLDNQCYFVGDTIWYKAFVVKSDSLKPTNYSRILYVELLTPDGYLVERQQRIINKGMTNGQFFLQDSIYSGYYEIRAYTRWDLNFNVEEREHSKNMYVFFSKEMEDDYFREFPGLYSRVVPIYEKPKKAGDYSDQRLVPRPKTRIITEKPKLKISFYPEGGNLIHGVKSRIAYEVTDGDGQAQDVLFILPDGKGIRPSFMGRGIFEYTPGDKTEEVKCTWNDHTYTFKLPKAQASGATITYDVEKRVATVTGTGAVAISCRGRMYHFERINGNNTTIDISKLTLPTGINEITVYGNDTQPLASRLIFIDNNDKGITVSKELTTNGTVINDSTKLQPYAPVELTLSKAGKDLSNASICVAVYDSGDLPLTYDDNNIKTSMLLSGEIRGFIPNPAYYFEKNDAQHRQNLDLLMMVQGWRKYKRTEKLRYLPELRLTYEGEVFKLPSEAEIIDLEEVSAPYYSGSTNLKFVSAVGHRVHYIDNDPADMNNNYMKYKGNISDNYLYCPGNPTDNEYVANVFVNPGHLDTCTLGDHQRTDFGFYEGKRVTQNQKGKEVKVEAELVVGKECAGVAAPIDKNGHFNITMPWFYDEGTLLVTAYKQKDSVKMNLTSFKDKKKLDETQYPNYYVKRDVFFPRFCNPYSWYQYNAPDDYEYIDPAINKEMALSNNRLAGDHYLANVNVRKHRKSKRALNYKKPAIKMDAYQLYNEVTDAGLSYGVLDMNKFTQQVSVYLFGYLDQNTWPKINGTTDSVSYFRNYIPTEEETDGSMTKTEMLSRLRLKRMLNILAFSDYDKRKGIRLEQDGKPAVTIRIESIPDDGNRYTFRDRHYTIEGITYAYDFYNYDYSKMQPPAEGMPADYRRTLYWNPNVKISADGSFHDTLYNNSRQTKVKVSLAGMDKNGQMYY